jgi:hypothetical protein
VSEDQRIKQLLREGIDAVREGDKSTARDRFEQVTELDENNERAWFYLAQVVDTDEDRRIALKNVLVINPNNEKARQQMDKLESKLRDAKADAEVVPGISRRVLMLVGGGGAAIVLAIVIITIVINSTNASREAAVHQQETQVAQLATGGAETAIFLATSGFETQMALIGTDTPTPRSNELPPTFTPSPGPTETPTPLLLPPPGPEIAGNIAAWGGIDSLSNGALEPRLYRISDGGNFTPIGDELGRDVRFGGNGDRIVYTRYFTPTFDFGLEVINTNGTQQQIIRSTIPVLDAGQPDYCETANKVVFVAVPEERPTGENIQFDLEPPTQLFIIDLDVIAQIAPGSEAPPSATIRLTNDGARYSYPAFSPDCSRVAVVRDDFNSAQAGPDVVVLEIANPTNITRVTTDLTTFIETSPRWSRDGSQLVFAAAQATSPNNSDIVVASATGSGAPQVPIRSDADDILPVFSPDGAYLAFSSSRQGPYNIFIYRVSDGQLFQLTNATSNIFVGGWWQ